MLKPDERRFGERLAKFLFANPFQLPAPEHWHQELLELPLELAAGERPGPPFPPGAHPTTRDFVLRVEALLRQLAQRWRKSGSPQGEALRCYEDLLIATGYFRAFGDTSAAAEVGDGAHFARAYPQFAELCRAALWPGLEVGAIFRDPAHLFAVFFQFRRSYDLLLHLVRGNSQPIQRFRAALWNSIFPHEQRLYGELLYDRMHEITTLILGPSGTGKELAAQAVGLSRYVRFDPAKRAFAEPLRGAFHAINLSALPRDLIESEMFGHCAGAFTGATRDRAGWFERCARGHAVFLDEIGELAEALQVKLLRVLQSREFCRVGETESRSFEGRIIAATNRDLERELRAGRFREDLFYRLCSDVVRTPTLREQLDDRPDELQFLVRLTAERCLGDRATQSQRDWLTELAVAWVLKCPALGPDYAWPGNFRELEQCVRSVMVRGEYHPILRGSGGPSPPCDAQSGAGLSAKGPPIESFLARVRTAELTYDELLAHYCSYVFARSKNLTAAAHQLGKHRATIEAKLQADLVRAYRPG